MVFSRSLFVSLLDRAERLIPSLTPESMKDDKPMMRPPVLLGKIDDRVEGHAAELAAVPASEGASGEVLLICAFAAVLVSRRLIVPHA